jgi:hypothetical protein
METETALVPSAAVLPATLMTKLGNFQSYMQKLWDGAHQDIERRAADLAEREREYAELETNIARLSDQASSVEDGGRQVQLMRNQLRGAKNKITRARRAHTDAVNFRDALAAGYVPLPQMPAIDLCWVDEIMPSDVLDAMEGASADGVFDSFRLVTGADASEGGYPRGRRPLGRDPILVGMVGREMFAIAWWR